MVSPDTPFPNNTNASVHPDGLDQLIPVLKQLSSHRVWLLPLLSLAGRHTLEDMAGHSPHSWKSRLEAAGFFCQAELRSLADDPTFVQLWLDRLESAMHQLNILPSSKINTS
jgi:sirohydrochlorin cobaltochelatase